MKNKQSKEVRNEMKDNILVIGGYGHVGKIVCEILGRNLPGKVIAAGRNLRKAEEFCQTTKGTVIPFELDISKPVPSELLSKVRVVVMCLDQRNLDFVRTCFNHKIHYVDISAKYTFLSSVKRLQAEAEKSNVCAVLSVGLAPGLTNLLASFAKSSLDRTEAIDIYIMLGLGDYHGKAAIEWTVNNLNSTYQIHSGSDKTQIEAFSGGKETSFGKNIGKRKGFYFNFSDQHTLPDTLKVPAVATRACFDSRIMTSMFALLKRAGVFKLLKYQSIRKMMVWLLSNIRFGKDTYAVKVDAFGVYNGKKVVAECGIQGQKESLITAKVAAKVAENLYTVQNQKGVYHIEELYDIHSIYNDLPSPEVFITNV
ncbi:saccharopine dehydrogenase NADP-binding domain-containing protein [Cytobacillus sp. IB215316]|uniref:saccharopine dehydrogenase NADP-binding domain-containing protein n=1 Tax=Cytobacillus sp. IB215316 TaxID=3097354 RepID=UPI002A0C4B39|nr:saccharopine dehydrogenase NADP-binding domain-containing protein [Cytobacillus sp. IB215316]MDX8360125.1 saccharopine dehydrogenase NADP-binding domain-containing protein [Cytobacillus sp. IB215316]